MTVCSPLASPQLQSSPSAAHCADPNQLRPYHPPALIAASTACHSRNRCAQPSTRATPAVAPPQPSEQARLNVPPPPLDLSSATESAAAPILPAGAAASSTSAPGPATHPITLSREEYHARYVATHSPRGQKCGKTPTPATSQAQQPESAGAAPKQSEESRPTTPSLPAPTASQTGVASASSFTTVAPAQKSPKPRKSRPRKRRTEDASPPAVCCEAGIHKR